MKRFERSNGLDTALYKNYLYILPLFEFAKCFCFDSPLSSGYLRIVALYRSVGLCIVLIEWVSIQTVSNGIAKY